MNKKEFYKRFLFLPIPKQYLDKIWEWIEKRDKKTSKLIDEMIEDYDELKLKGVENIRLRGKWVSMALTELKKKINDE